jgi:V/A-type H+-transporting ATPase subunit I
LIPDEMAIAEVRKIHLVVHRSQQGDLMAEIQRLGVVEVCGGGEEGEAKVEEKTIASRLARTDRALRLLRPWFPARPLAQRVYPERPAYTQKELLEVAGTFDLSNLLAACEGNSRELDHLQVSLSRLDEERRTLALWSALDAPPSMLRSSRRVEIVTGRIPVREKGGFIEALDEVGAVVERAWEDDRNLYAVVLCLTACGEEIHGIMDTRGFQRLKLPDLEMTPGERLELIDGERIRTEGRIRELRESYRTLAGSEEQIRVVRDLLANHLERLRTERRMTHTRDTVSLEGWIPAREFAKIRRHLLWKFPLMSIRDYDPDPEEKIPVILENSPLVSPFGVVVGLYGLPRYGAVDPSPVLAAFFALFFGLCLTDAGYGLFLAALTGGLLVFAPRPLPEGGERFVRMFFLCGLATAAVGAAAGGWFGVSSTLRLFDPLEDLMLFFGIALAAGTLHLFAGLLLRMWRLIRSGDIFGAAVDHGLWMALVLALYGTAAAAAGHLPPWAGRVFQACAVGSALGIVFFQGRPGRKGGDREERAHHLAWGGVTLCATLWLLGTGRPWSGLGALLFLSAELFLLETPVKAILARLGLGLYSLYGVTGYLSDVLSYSRLVALGLGTGIVAMVVNKMAVLAFGAPGVGFILGAFVFVIGHMFNVLINLLGAFVHSCRLQYVEFFTKFFESGGRPFSPFRFANRYITIKEQG